MSLINKHILNTLFDNIYIPYISENEIENILWKLKEQNIKVQYFKGHNGHLMTDQNHRKFINQQIIKKNKNKDIVLLTKGQIGHINTFIMILQDAMKNNYKKILILEPDVYLCNDISERIKQYIDFDYKMMYLGASQFYYYKENTWEYIDKNINLNYYHPYKTLGTFAISFDHSMYNEIIELLSSFLKPTDIALIELQEKYNENTYVCYPNLVACNVVKSSTSGVRNYVINQVTRAKECRWNLKYDTRHKMVIDKNGKYDVKFGVNSYYNDYTINVVGDYEMIKNYNNIMINANNAIIIEHSNIFFD